MIYIVLLFSLILRLINLNQSLWLDEAVQAIVAKNSLAFTFEELKGDFHPPLFHLLMHFWVRVFGSTEIALRMPSVLFGVGTVLVVYLLIKKLTDSKINGLIAVVFLATAPFHIYYSQEARMYSMVTFFASMSMYCFIKILTNSKINELKNYLFYIFASVLAIYSDYYALLVILAQIIAGIIILRKKMTKLIPCYIAILVLFLPVLPLLISQLKTGIIATQNLPGWGRLVNLSFIKALPLTFIKFSIGRITIFDKRLYGLVALGVLGVFGGVGGYGFLKILKSKVNPSTGSGLGSQKSEKESYLIVFLWLVVPVLSAWLVSLIVPNYQPFRLLLVLPAFYLLLAYGVTSINHKIILGIVTSVILGINLISVGAYYTNPFFWREDWRGVAKFVKSKNLPIVISAQAFNWPLVYYGVSEKVVPVAPGAAMTTLRDKPVFLGHLADLREVLYTPYLADLYDSSNLIPNWLSEAKFVKLKEVSFNQIPLWLYQE